MADQIVITEKSSQAKDVRAAVGVNRRPIWTPGENAITHYSQTIFEKKEGVTVGRRSNTPEISNFASASTTWCTIGVGSKLDADLQPALATMRW
jgi:hypothetical protein